MVPQALLTVGMPHRREEPHLRGQERELGGERQSRLEEAPFTIECVSQNSCDEICVALHTTWCPPVCESRISFRARHADKGETNPMITISHS